MTNLAGILEEMTEASGGGRGAVAQDIEEEEQPARQGRPRKAAAARPRRGRKKSAAAETAEQQAPKTKGRARKAVAASTTRNNSHKTDSSNTTKRGRGRPRKTAT